ncbi:MAG: hypothetical protein IJV05_09735, partial [Muribaculaceae bacterium]|nr:hypothetical protein [Muribaculaceae bacterium]
HVCQWFLTGFYCSTKLGEIPDMAKSWATFCCPGCYKVISKMCCGFKALRKVSIYEKTALPCDLPLVCAVCSVSDTSGNSKNPRALDVGQ